MVPGSTLMYGSIFRRVTVRPLHSINAPMLAADNPFPREERTPPVMNMNLVLLYMTCSRSTQEFDLPTVVDFESRKSLQDDVTRLLYYFNAEQRLAQVTHD